MNCTNLKMTRFAVIYNGINKDFFDTVFSSDEIRKDLKIPKDTFLVGHVGRVDTAKNHPTILKVARIVCKENSKIHFILAGNGTDNLVVGDFKDRIHLLGYRNDIRKLLAAMDLFYFPSLTEGQSNALIEAMVKGLAIISSNIEPIKETMPEKMIDELVAPLDAQKAAEKILRAAEDKSYRDSLKCKEWAIEHFDADKLFGQFKKELQYL